eukprot:m51a1_g6925 hypothetical protein (608) ;mRNA; f:163727-166415
MSGVTGPAESRLACSPESRAPELDMAELLPREACLRVMRYLDLRSLLLGVCLTRKRWAALANDEMLWRRLYIARWIRKAPMMPKPALPLLQAQWEGTWRELYMARLLTERRRWTRPAASSKDYNRRGDQLSAETSASNIVAYDWVHAGKLPAAEILHIVSVEHYRSATYADPEDALAPFKWGQGLANRAMQRMDSSSSDPKRSEALFREAYAQMASAAHTKEVFQTWALTLYNHASMYVDEDFAASEALLVESIEKYEMSDAMSQPVESQTVNGIADAMECLSQLKDNSPEIDFWFSLAIKKYREAADLEPSNGAVLNNWGLAYHNHAFTKTGMAAQDLLQAAVEKYTQALLLESEKYVILYNMGDALAQLAHITPDPARSDALFEQASQQYARSLEVKKDYFFTPNNWGWSYFEQASRKTGIEFEELLAKATKQFEAALGIRPNYHVSIANLGNVWLSRACRAQDFNEALMAFDRARENYERALQIRPRFYKAMHYLGLLLLEKSRRLPRIPAMEAQKRGMLRSALQYCQESLMIKSNYNACMFTAAHACMLLGDAEQCAVWIAKYNRITGGSGPSGIELKLEHFVRHGDDPEFSYKTFFWRYCSQ